MKGSGHPGEDRFAQPRTRSPPPVNDTSLRLRIPHVKTGALGGRERANLWMGFAITSRCKSGSGGELPRCLVRHHAVHEFASRVDRLQELRSVQPAERPLGASIKRLRYARWRCATEPRSRRRGRRRLRVRYPDVVPELVLSLRRSGGRSGRGPRLRSETSSGRREGDRVPRRRGFARSWRPLGTQPRCQAVRHRVPYSAGRSARASPERNATHAPGRMVRDAVGRQEVAVHGGFRVSASWHGPCSMAVKEVRMVPMVDTMVAR